MRSFEVTVVQSLGRHAEREVKMTVENMRNAGEAWRNIANRLARGCRVKKVEEV